MMRAVALTLLAGFILLPLVQAVLLSFTATLPQDGLAEGALGLMNYRAVLAAPELRAAMLNSAMYVLLNVALCIALALPAVYGLARYRFMGDRHFLLAILVFRVTPPVVLSLPIFILFAELGLVISRSGSRWSIACSTCPWRSGSWKASSAPFRANWTRPRSLTAIPGRHSSFAT
jgi:glycerol transport system permease protein